MAGPWLHGAVIALLEGGREEDNTEMDPFLLAMPHLLLQHTRDGVLDECGKVRSTARSAEVEPPRTWLKVQ